MESGDADARAVLLRYGLSDASIEALGNAGGFSGARIWRVTADSHQFCLKRWPSMPTGRHEQIVGLMRSARGAGLSFVPTTVPSSVGTYHVARDGTLWDLTDWMPGIADFRANPSMARLRSACTALARLHRAWEPFAVEAQQCPGVIRRLTIVRNSLDVTYRSPGVEASRRSPGDSALPHWVRRAELLVQRHLRQIPDALAAWQFKSMAVQPCLCDVWHDHVLFTGDDVTGLIDYGSVKLDNVAVDLARLLGSLIGDDAAMYEIGLDAYHSERPLTAAERGLVRVIDRASVVLALANWCRRLVDKWHLIDDRTAVGRRIEGLVRRAERWRETI